MENIIKATLTRFSLTKHTIDSCIDKDNPKTIMTHNQIVSAIIHDKNRGIRSRVITEITKDNLSYCKELIDLKNEVRHLDDVIGNFSISDRSIYQATAMGDFSRLVLNRPQVEKLEPTPVTETIYSTMSAFVAQQQYFFDMLWKKAIPAKERIKELEEGIPPEVLEPLREPKEIVETGYRLIRSAKNEILIIFHTANALLHQDKAGGVGLLVETAVKYQTSVKILVPFEDKIIGVIQRLEQFNGIQIRNIEPTMQTRMTVLVVDKKYSLVVELKDDTKDSLEEAIGLATYSNSKSTVLSYVTIFDTLWKQSELREELLNRSIAQKEFINIAAHELRNPIQPILSLSNVLLRSDTFSDSTKIDNNGIKQKEILEIIARNARRLQHLTEDILDITRIEGKALKLNKQNFVLHEIVMEIVQGYTAKIRDSNRNLALSFAISEELKSTSIIADQNRIKQVISNLIDNAIKFTQEGKITVTAKIDNERNILIVKVEDTGTGIDSDILPKLFTKFVTRSSSGTGLGLYICKAIIEEHNGMIWAENNYDHNGMNAGATFSISLPMDT